MEFQVFFLLCVFSAYQVCYGQKNIFCNEFGQLIDRLDAAITRRIKKSTTKTPAAAKWVNATVYAPVIPQDAVRTFDDFLITRTAVPATKNIVPCKYVVKHKSCFYAWAKEEVRSFKFQILTSIDVEWKSGGGKNWQPHPNSVPVGLLNGDKVYICRALHLGSFELGRLDVQQVACITSYGEKIFPYKSFDVLVQKQLTSPPNQLSSNSNYQ